MKDFKSLVQEFKSDEFRKEYKHTKMLISNEEHLNYAVMIKAYKDAQMRTVKKLKGDSQFDECGKNKVLMWLVKEIQECINNKDYEDKTNFDNWHNYVCKEFVSKFNKEVLKENYKHIKYGKAQKIVNMSFKYLRCFDDAEMHLKLFNNCHMPIDSYVIDWYNKEISNAENRIDCPWSNFNEKCYIEIQNNIREKCKNITPLEKDFYVWKNEKEKRTSK